MADTIESNFRNSLQRQTITNKQAAFLLNKATSTIRGQQLRRRRGVNHWLTIDPVYLGTIPSYLPDEFEAFLAELRNKRTPAP